MFLVTYNFDDMPVNHMTFLRHRIFLVPVEEGAEGKGEASPGGTVLERKKILCYLMHLRYDRGFRRIRYFYIRRSSNFYVLPTVTSAKVY